MANKNIPTEIQLKVLERVAAELQSNLYTEIINSHIIGREELAQNYYVQVNPETMSIEVHSTSDPAKFIDQKTRTKKLEDITGKAAPLKSSEGAVIKRITWEQSRSGRSVNSGITEQHYVDIKGQHFIDSAIAKTKERYPKILKEELSKLYAKTFEE